MVFSPAKFAKSILKWVLIALLCWHCFLGIRDSDGRYLENRLRQTFKFLELNSEFYRTTIRDTIDPNIEGIDGRKIGKDVRIMAELSPVIVFASAHLAAFGAVFLVLNSRIGCWWGALHGIFLLLAFNMNVLEQSFKGLLGSEEDLHYQRVTYSDQVPVPWDSEFWKKQETYHCDWIFCMC
mmetsp:Transcript_16930/g.26062  ORF Transcript_16930/g.26062 Transcript_16930/m.26062 type:complete len:181 (+) Transcript_16930:3-545(+)